ncbi:hypothetical protein Brsp07_05230 [Brucella sp. NBRC 14130]|uniref:helix-turn-helix domain-containing protein n=1 Tax=Brucella sp. NBRC 14130 TaxID=3075483 RepID=UPI00309AD8E4
MQIGRVTTPHGRPMTLALVKGQLETADRGPSKAVNKWKVFNDIGETKDSFALQDRSITVLQASRHESGESVRLLRTYEELTPA